MMQRFLIDPRRFPAVIFVTLLWAALMCCSLACDQSTNQSPSAVPARNPQGVASLVPAATNIIRAMGQERQLFAVSNWEPPSVTKDLNLPMVGDYRSIDWEKLTQIRPKLMIVQWGAQKAPPGLEEKAASLSCTTLNVTINRQDDIFTTIGQIGEQLNARSDADKLIAVLREQFARVQTQVAGKPKIRTLILHSESSLAAVGRNNYLNDLLEIAGGENVIDGPRPYVDIDAEKMLAMKPDAVFQLLPGASPQVVQKANTFWATFPDLPAVKNHRVHILTGENILLPAANTAYIAETFAEKLHPLPATQPAEAQP